MKKIMAMFLCTVLILATFSLSGCKFFNTTASTGKSVTQKGSFLGKSKVFQPDELLPPADAAKIVGLPSITIDPGTLKVDPESGMSSTYYTYDIPDGTLHALFQLVQNGAMTKENWNTVQRPKAYDGYYFKVKDESDLIKGLGDKAFFFKSQAQLFVLSGDYFFLLAFEATDENKSREVNIGLAKKILENIKSKQ